MAGRSYPRKCKRSILISIEVSIEATLAKRTENKKSRRFFHQLTDLLLIVELAVSFLRQKWCERWKTHCRFVLSETVNPTVNLPALKSKWKNRI